MQISINVNAEGDLTLIYNDDLAGLLAEGQAKVTRASHVEPHPAGGWTADMSPITGGHGPVLGPFPLHSAALEAERLWLEEHLFAQ